MKPEIALYCFEKGALGKQVLLEEDEYTGILNH